MPGIFHAHLYMDILLVISLKHFYYSLPRSLDFGKVMFQIELVLDSSSLSHIIMSITLREDM